jgi:hypothetical protein
VLTMLRRNGFPSHLNLTEQKNMESKDEKRKI